MIDMINSDIIEQACTEIFNIKYLLNQNPEYFNPTDIIIEVAKKYDIPFNVLDRITNWARRDNEELSEFVKIKDVANQTGYSYKDIRKMADLQFVTVLLISGTAYVRNTIIINQ